MPRKLTDHRLAVIAREIRDTDPTLAAAVDELLEHIDHLGDETRRWKHSASQSGEAIRRMVARERARRARLEARIRELENPEELAGV
ncbi:MAG: hypothetical protein AAFZ07_25755 [Actinomycetota bacterium]